MDLKNFFDLDSLCDITLWKLDEMPWRPLLLLQNYLDQVPLGKIEIDIPSSVHIDNPERVSIGKNTRIEPGAYIQGPCLIGEGSVIRHGAYLRGNVITGKRCIIGHDTEIKHSILLNDVSAAHFAYIGDSILGNGVNLGAGVKCANYRLDQKFVPVHALGKKIDSGLKKFGAIIGDHSQIGCNSVLNPGTLVGMRSICYPLLSIMGYIPPDSKVTK